MDIKLASMSIISNFFSVILHLLWPILVQLLLFTFLFRLLANILVENILNCLNFGWFFTKLLCFRWAQSLRWSSWTAATAKGFLMRPICSFVMNCWNNQFFEAEFSKRGWYPYVPWIDLKTRHFWNLKLQIFSRVPHYLNKMIILCNACTLCPTIKSMFFKRFLTGVITCIWTRPNMSVRFLQRLS